MLTLPDLYFIALGFAAVLIIFAVANLRTSWGIPYFAVVFTVAAWYFIEPLYLPEEFRHFEPNELETAYSAILIALVSFAGSTPVALKLTRPKQNAEVLTTVHVSAERVLIFVTSLWLLLLAYGTFRMEGDLLGALFPLGARSGVHMWSRAAGAGSGADGFIVSTASYLYLLCLASFGILRSLVQGRLWTSVVVLLMLISWPYVVLQGSRNLVLAVVLPGLCSYMLFSGHGLLRKGIVAASSLACLDLLFRIIIQYRNEGYRDVDIGDLEGVRHLGLNMASELAYCVQYIVNGRLEISYGQRYLAELLNVIPRAFWPDKPLIGIDYAVARGFGGAAGDIGVNATLSTGLIGGGVLNFGLVVGPIIVGLLMSLWVGLLSRFRLQRSPLRLTLFLIGLGLTFNLGRDITLLVLWPLVFGYIVVRFIEWRSLAGRPSRIAPPRNLKGIVG